MLEVRAWNDLKAQVLEGFKYAIAWHLSRKEHIENSCERHFHRPFLFRAAQQLQLEVWVYSAGHCHEHVTNGIGHAVQNLASRLPCDDGPFSAEAGIGSGSSYIP